jgi:hypothetical protein
MDAKCLITCVVYPLFIMYDVHDDSIIIFKICHRLDNSLFSAQFYPEGLKAYTRNIYKQRTQVK